MTGSDLETGENNLGWIHWCLKQTCGFTSRHLHIPRKTLFIFGLWTLWLNRNSVAFQGRQPNPSISKICIAKTAEFHFLIQGADAQNKKIQHPVSWTKPELGRYKLNTDASVLHTQTVQVGVGLKGTLMALGLEVFLDSLAPPTAVLLSSGLCEMASLWPKTSTLPSLLLMSMLLRSFPFSLSQVVIIG